MKYKKIIILAIFLVSLLAISAVSAADNSTSGVVGVDNINDKVDSEQNLNSEDVLSYYSESELLEDYYYDYDE